MKQERARQKSFEHRERGDFSINKLLLKKYPLVEKNGVCGSDLHLFLSFPFYRGRLFFVSLFRVAAEDMDCFTIFL
jgi:hypothetical protein